MDNSVETVEYLQKKQGIKPNPRWTRCARLWKTLWKLWINHIAKCNKMKSVKLHNAKKRKAGCTKNRKKTERRADLKEALRGKQKRNDERKAEAP